MNRLELLNQWLEMTNHNLYCYSKDFLMNEPKEEYKEEWKKEKEKSKLIKEFIEEEIIKLEKGEDVNMNKENELLNKYESVILVDPKIKEIDRQKVIDKIEKFLKNNGKVENVENLGKKKLAYEVKKNKEAYYYVINFEATKETVEELERMYRIIDEILKFIVVKRD